MTMFQFTLAYSERLSSSTFRADKNSFNSRSRTASDKPAKTLKPAASGFNSRSRTASDLNSGGRGGRIGPFQFTLAYSERQIRWVGVYRLIGFQFTLAYSERRWDTIPRLAVKQVSIHARVQRATCARSFCFASMASFNSRSRTASDYGKRRYNKGYA